MLKVDGGEDVNAEDETSSDYLYYGDLISFFDNDRRGFMLSHLVGSQYSSLSVKAGGDKSNPRIGNFVSCVFEVQPHHKYKAHRKYDKALSDFRKKHPNISETDAVNSDDELFNLKVLRDAERADNLLEKKRRFGDKVVYGQLVQLFHLNTEQYVRISSNITSKREPSNMKVEMSADLLKHAWFRIMPRYKVRAEGDFVRMTDQVVLESAKTPGQFLHSSQLPLGRNSPDEGKHEINLSVTPTSFTICPFRQPVANDAELLKGGDVIQLFHKEQSGYIAAEGVFTEPKPRLDIHIRQRNPDPKRPNRLFPPTSAVSFFQVELEGEPTKGSIISWETQVRFRHVTTQKYLCMRKVDGGKFVSYLSDDIRDPAGVFLMHAVIREQPYVQKGTYSRIQNNLYGCWLHAEVDQVVKRNPDAQSTKFSHLITSGLADRMATIEWDGAPLFQLTGTPERMFDDAYIITNVPRVNVGHVVFVSGIIPVLQMYVRDRAERELTNLETMQLVETLREFADWMVVDGHPDKMRQKILRNMGVVETLISMLQVPFRPYNTSASAVDFQSLGDPRHKNTKQVAVAVYSVLEAYLNGDSRKNELYICRHIGFFQTQIGGLLPVEEMYIELVCDNFKVISQMKIEEIMQFIDLLRRDKNPDCLNFLCVLCECEGVPINENQNLICDALLGDPENPLIYRTRLHPQRGDCEISLSGRGGDWISLRDFAVKGMQGGSSGGGEGGSSGGDLDAGEPSREYAFLLAQLELFGNLCSGRNDHCIGIIAEQLKYLSWEECFHCVTDESLPKDLRAEYVELMRHLFVDVGENVDILEDIQLWFSWRELASHPHPDAASQPATSISGAKMPQFPALSKWILDFLNRNPLIVASDMPNNRLIEQVIRLINILIKFGYYADPHVINKLMTPLVQLVDGRQDMPHEHRKVNFKGQDTALAQWRQEGRFQKSTQNDVVVALKQQAVACINTMYNYIFTVRLEHFLFDFKQVSEWTGDRHATRSNKPQPFDLAPGPTLTPEQMKFLQILTRCDSTQALEHIAHVRGYLSDLFTRSNWMLPGWYPGMEVKDGETDVVASLMDLAKYDYPDCLTRALEMVDRFFSAQHDLFDMAKQALLLTEASTISFAKNLSAHQVPMLRRLGAGQIERCEMEPFNLCLTDLAAKCYLEDGESPHDVHQSIIYNVNLLPLIIDVIDCGNQEPEVLRACFHFLSALAFKNPAVQDELFGHLDTFFAARGLEDGWQDTMAILFAHIFENNQHNCMAIKSTQVQAMVQILAKHNVAVPCMLKALRTLTKIGDVPLRRNQSLIIKYIMSHREHVTAPALLHDTGRQDIVAQRQVLLRSNSSDEEMAARLAYHLNLMSLFASCAEGENKFIESMCQTLFTLDEMLDILSDKQFRSIDKTAYLHFFMWVYITTEGSSVELGTDRLPSEPRLWQALVMLANDVVARLFADNTTAIDRQQSDFLFDAYLPLLTRVVQTFYVPAENPDSRKAVRQVARAVADMVRRGLTHITVKDHLKTISSCLFALNLAEGDCVERGVLQDLASRLTTTEAGLLESKFVRQHKQRFEKHYELNALLNKFASNVRVAYRGHNTIPFQMNLTNLPMELNEKNYCEDETDDEALPLGPEFQSFIALFATYKPTSTGREIDEISQNVKSLIRFLDQAVALSGTLDASDLKLQVRSLVKVLQLIRAIVHNEIKLQGDVIRVQDEICAFGATLPIADVLHHSHDMVVREALACLVVLLLDGNKEAQASFERHFLSTREETFFIDIMQRMRRAIDGLVEERAVARQAADEATRQNKLMGTMTLAAKVGNQLSNALAVAEADEQEGETLEMASLTAAKADGGAGSGSGAGAHPHLHLQTPPPAGNDASDESNIELVLRVLQLLCEGHNSQMQNYLREQPDNMRSIDLVSMTVELLRTLVTDITDDNIELVIQTMETLVEFAQGCQGNQCVIFDAQAVDSMNTILRQPKFPGANDEKVAHLKLACGNLLGAMLEDSDEKTVEIANELSETLDINSVLRNMQHYFVVNKVGAHHEWKVDSDKDDEPTEPMEVAYSFYNVLRRLTDFKGTEYHIEKPKTVVLSSFNADEPREAEEEDATPQFCELEGMTVEEVFNRISEHSVSIEIMRSGRIQKIHFLDKWSPLLRRDVKEKLKWTVDRTSPSDKIRSFVEMSRTIIADIDYIKEMRALSPIFRVFVQYSAVWGSVMLWLTFLLNIFILVDWDAPEEISEKYPVVHDWYDICLAVFGCVHLFLACLTTTSYFIINPPDGRAFLESIPLVGGYLVGLLPEDDSPRTRTSLLSISSLYHLFLPVMSALGLVYHGYFFAYHLFFIIVGHDLLQRVLMSVTKNGISLLWVFALMVMVIYVYALASFAYYRDLFDPADSNYCSTSWQCFITSLRLGFTDGLGTALPHNDPTFTDAGVRMIFDLSFFIVITTIGLNVVFGIIVDTFSELRDEKYQIQEAMESECFICSLKNYDFERFGNGFRTHVKKEHYMWNYLFYMMHLAEKDPTEYNSHEQYMADMLSADCEGQVFPINRALVLQNTESSGVEERLEKVEAALQALIARFDRESDQRQAAERHQRLANWQRTRTMQSQEP
eukprot:m.168492 g.168492  ORF g.168492 m.168492 type:complete len:2590 (+) comp17217_c0_seq4:243-8012(+)